MRARVPHRHRILLGEIRWRPPKWDSRVLASLVPDGAAPHTQQSHPSAVEAVGARNADLPSGWSLLTTPLPEPPWPAIGPCASRGAWASLGGPLEWPGRLKCIPIPQEGDFGIFEAATESPARGFGHRRAPAGLGATARYPESFDIQFRSWQSPQAGLPHPTPRGGRGPWPHFWASRDPA